MDSTCLAAAAATASMDTTHRGAASCLGRPAGGWRAGGLPVGLQNCSALRSQRSGGKLVDEIIVRVARTVACRNRLRILACLARSGEMAPSALADELGLTPDLICAHCARLTTAGLMRRRRSGVWRYCEARSPYPGDSFSGKVSQWLRRLLSDPPRAVRNCATAQRPDSGRVSAEDALHDILMDAVTAFTSVRRLQVLRRLTRGDAPTVDPLTKELHMSPAALSRHTAKLMRRGYVQARRVGRTMVYRLAPTFKTPVHARLWGIVRRAWEFK